MKMVLFGWLLKGRCDVTLLDQLIGGLVVVAVLTLAFLAFTWWVRK